MKRKAFTLVELLVVIAVLVVLLAIILPGLGKARASARRAACMAHERGLTQTLHMYIQAWNSLLPYVPSPFNLNQWAVPLNPYGNIDGLRRCPEANTPNNKPGDRGASDKPWNQSFTGPKQSGAFAFNGWLYRPLVVYKPGSPGNPAILTKYPDDDEDEDVDDGNDGEDEYSDNAPIIIPARPPTPGGNSVIADASLYYRLPIRPPSVNVPVFADAVWSDTFPREGDPAPSDLVNGKVGFFQLGLTCIARHDKSINVSYFDGHTENVRLEKLWTQEWHVGWKTPSPVPTIPNK